MLSNTNNERHDASQSQRKKESGAQFAPVLILDHEERDCTSPPLHLPSRQRLSPCFSRRRGNNMSSSPDTSRFLRECASPSSLLVAKEDLLLPNLDEKDSSNCLSSSRKIITLRPRFSPIALETRRNTTDESEDPQCLFDERDRGMIFMQVMDESSSLQFPRH
jgi:hypothetical protein